ncbi:FecR family protein [Mucilaginibacter lappiensis]|uniref:FecR family protein n=1 Tax=Mucilaginibacter lappiensis TaxID=354630 RepID=UPI003D1F7FD6
MTPEQYILLYEKHLSGLCTPEEEELLMQHKDNFKIHDDQEIRLLRGDKLIRRSIYGRIVQSVSGSKSRVVKMAWWWTAAAMVLLSIGLGSLFFNNQPQKLIVKNEIKKTKNNIIKPGTTTAVLTLANGANIVLDNAANGVVATSGNTAIKKLKNGLLSYTDNGTDAGVDANALNTITIPRGGQYTVTLPDGTNVWLNSESSLTYPVGFKGTNRKVSLKGEAYFEVAKNKQMPFIVHTNEVDVKVLGTHFNVKAYQDDSGVKTTLLEGSVRLSNTVAFAMLVPGEQGVADRSAKKIAKKKANINQVMAWKSGYFVFREDDIHDIMKQISRWYDVDVEYRGNMSNIKFGGTYSKNKDINELLKGLELTGLIHFKIEGRRIIVMT